MTVSPETSGTPSSRLRAGLGGLPSAERRVAAVLLADPELAVHDTAASLAQRAGASAPTVVRLAYRLGYGGFPELKIALAGELGRDRAATAAGAVESYATVMQRDAQSIREAIEVLDADALRAAAGAIALSGETFFCGTASSAGFAALCALRFSAIGVRAASAGEPLTQRLHAESLRPTDACVAISHTGESIETVDALRAARSAGAATVAVTSFAGSPVTEPAQITLVCTRQPAPATRETLFANPVALLSVLGALHAEVVNARAASPEIGEDRTP